MHSLRTMRCSSSMNSPIPVDFTNVVDQGKQLPLHIDFGFRANGEVVQSFLDAEIGKDRFNDRQTPGIDLPALQVCRSWLSSVRSGWDRDSRPRSTRTDVRSLACSNIWTSLDNLHNPAGERDKYHRPGSGCVGCELRVSRPCLADRHRSAWKHRRQSLHP